MARELGSRLDGGLWGSFVRAKITGTGRVSERSPYAVIVPERQERTER